MNQFVHPWDVTPQEAKAIQERLRNEISLNDWPGPVRTVAGIDVGYEQAGAISLAAAVVLRFPGLEIVDRAMARLPSTFPYLPGLLSFREAPAALQALAQLKTKPDLLICDGHGYAHPRRFGLACHVGLLSGIPSIGAAKTRLIGWHEPLGVDKGEREPLSDGEEIIGMVVRTRTNVKPIYVSSGHMISLVTAVDYVLACTTKYRLPETTRLAHRLASG